MEKAMAPTPVARQIPWTEEPGRLQSMGSLRVRHDWTTLLWLFTFMHWRRKWQPTPVFLPGESHGQRSLVGCHLWGHTDSDTTEVTQQQQQQGLVAYQAINGADCITKCRKISSTSSWLLAQWIFCCPRSRFSRFLWILEVVSPSSYNLIHFVGHYKIFFLSSGTDFSSRSTE